MRFRMAALVMAGVAVAALLAGGERVSAQQDPAQLVKAREDLMKSFFPNYYRGFVQVARGESTDIAAIPDKARQAAAEVRKIPALFPAGTGRDKVPATRAKPEVWSERAEFEANVAKLAAETEKLGDIAKGGNIDAVKAQVAVVSQACGACHGGPIKSGGKFRFEEQ